MVLLYGIVSSNFLFFTCKLGLGGGIVRLVIRKMLLMNWSVCHSANHVAVTPVSGLCFPVFFFPHSELAKEKEGNKVPPRFELGLLDSESNVLTTRPWDHLCNVLPYKIFIGKMKFKQLIILYKHDSVAKLSTSFVAVMQSYMYMIWLSILLPLFSSFGPSYKLWESAWLVKLL